MAGCDHLSPVETIPTDPADRPPQPGTALCLPGGDYRAMLFLGALWRLNDAGYLPKLERVSSVSGGSITAGVLGSAWSGLAFQERRVARQHFEQLIVQPIRCLASTTIDKGAVLRGLLGKGTAGDRVANSYREHLFGDRTPQDLPDRPRFVINAANVQWGAL